MAIRVEKRYLMTPELHLLSTFLGTSLEFCLLSAVQHCGRQLSNALSFSIRRLAACFLTQNICGASGVGSPAYAGVTFEFRAAELDPKFFLH